MTIGLDGTPLTGPVGGIRRFTEELTAALQAEFPHDEFILMSDQMDAPRWPWERFWWLLGLNQSLRRQGVALFHGTDFAVPYLPRIPSLLTLHDLSPWREPSAISSRVRNRTAYLLRRRIPTRVHTPSEAIRREAIEFFRLPPDYVVSIPLAAALRFTPRRMTPGRPYFLYLGALEERKNLGVLVEAARILWSQGLDFDLRFAGRPREGFTLPTEARLLVMGEQAEDDLAPLYSNCVASLYASRYEGFGLPVLEAMQCGAAVIASGIPVLSEIGGSAALYASPADPQEWAACMRLLLLDLDLRTRHQTASLARVQQFSWIQTARRFRNLYEQCIG